MPNNVQNKTKMNGFLAVAFLLLRLSCLQLPAFHGRVLCVSATGGRLLCFSCFLGRAVYRENAHVGHSAIQEVWVFSLVLTEAWL
jgi:hypothetical protein